MFFPYVANADPQAAARLRQLRFPADQGIAGHTLAHGTAVRVDDATADPRCYGRIDQDAREMTRTVLAAPLAADHGPIGVLQVVNRIGGGTFSDDDLAFLEALAGSVAGAVENARRRLGARPRRLPTARQRAAAGGQSGRHVRHDLLRDRRPPLRRGDLRQRRAQPAGRPAPGARRRGARRGRHALGRARRRAVLRASPAAAGGRHAAAVHRRRDRSGRRRRSAVLRLSASGVDVQAVIEDNGIPFDPTPRSPPAPSTTAPSAAWACTWSVARSIACTTGATAGTTW